MAMHAAPIDTAYGAKVRAGSIHHWEPSRMIKDRFTWLGMALVIAGWAMLLADMLISDSVLKSGNLVAVISLRSDVITIAQTAILSGFGLGVIGSLRAGFGALNRFFDAVLQRSSTPRPAPVVETPDPQPVVPVPHVERMPQSGQIKDSNYVILPDGSVEVDTLLGTRVFASLDEARDFIR